LGWLLLVYILTYETSLFEQLEKMGQTDIYIGPTSLVSLLMTRNGKKTEMGKREGLKKSWKFPIGEGGDFCNFIK